MQQRWRVGDVTITPVLELEWVLEENWLIPEGTPAALNALPWLRPHYITDRAEVILFIQSFVVESRGLTIVVDTCVGNDKPRRAPRFNGLQTPWLDRLRAVGGAVEGIDRVVCTHLHFDHVGWNTRLERGAWVPTFPNARYLISRAEWESCSDDTRDHLDDSVRPIFDAELVDLIEPEHDITEEVSTAPTPGHTPGHISVHVRSRGEHAVITGDMIHHPSQCAHPNWRCAADTDPALATLTRRRFLEACADTSTLVIGSHFAAPTAGHIVRDGDRWRFVPE